MDMFDRVLMDCSAQLSSAQARAEEGTEGRGLDGIGCMECGWVDVI